VPTQNLPSATAPAPTTPAHVHFFNNDLLMNDASKAGKSDLEKARERFPEIVHVLDCPALREKFAEYEKDANDARKRVRALGFTAVLSVAISLIAIATKPILRPEAEWTHWVGALMELAGLIATIIAVSGLWLGDWKRQWLESRLMTERLRQWHFQLLIRRGKALELYKKAADMGNERAKNNVEFLQKPQTDN
jgi:hypothetical protein